MTTNYDDVMKRKNTFKKEVDSVRKTINNILRINQIKLSCRESYSKVVGRGFQVVGKWG